MEANIISAGITGLSTIISSIIQTRKSSNDNALISSEEIIEIQTKLMAIQTEAYRLIEENHKLRHNLDLVNEQLTKEKDIERHRENYITLVSDNLKIKYCTSCFGKDQRLIQLVDSSEETGSAYCPICKNDYIINNYAYSAYLRSLNHHNNGSSSFIL